MVSRFAGDFQGSCKNCDEYIEFAVGVRPGTDPVAMHFGPGGPTPVELRDVELSQMIDDALDLRLHFLCPLCKKWSAGRMTCKQASAMPPPE